MGLMKRKANAAAPHAKSVVAIDDDGMQHNHGERKKRSSHENMRQYALLVKAADDDRDNKNTRGSNGFNDQMYRANASPDGLRKQ